MNQKFNMKRMESMEENLEYLDTFKEPKQSSFSQLSQTHLSSSPTIRRKYSKEAPNKHIKSIKRSKPTKANSSDEEDGLDEILLITPKKSQNQQKNQKNLKQSQMYDISEESIDSSDSSGISEGEFSKNSKKANPLAKSRVTLTTDEQIQIKVEDIIQKSHQELATLQRNSDILENFVAQNNEIIQEQFKNSDLKDQSKQNLGLRSVRSESEFTRIKGKQKILSLQEDTLGIHNFKFLAKLGEGAYGRVWLVEKIETKDLYAMKIIAFQNDDKRWMQNMINEHKIMRALVGPYLVKGIFSFTHENYYCIIMDLMNGGDFKNILKEEVYFEQEAAQFYLAQLLEAIEHLHEQGIVHRDLKPDNILLDQNGMLKLADFGLSDFGQAQQDILNSHRNQGNHLKTKLIPCVKMVIHYLDSAKQLKQALDYQNSSNSKKMKPPSTGDFDELTLQQQSKSKDRRGTLIGSHRCRIMSDVISVQVGSSNKSLLSLKKQSSEEQPTKTFRICGTPDYMSPEMIKQLKQSDVTMDIWAFGVILYEFLVGVNPYNEKDPQTTWNNVLSKNIQFPPIGYEEEQMTPEAYDLINKLLTVELKDRLTDIEEIKRHPFFKGIKWNQIEKNKKAELIPYIQPVRINKNQEVSPEVVFGQMEKMQLGSNLKSEFSMVRNDILKSKCMEELEKIAQIYQFLFLFLILF